MTAATTTTTAATFSHDIADTTSLLLVLLPAPQTPPPPLPLLHVLVLLLLRLQLPPLLLLLLYVATNTGIVTTVAVLLLLLVHQLLLISEETATERCQVTQTWYFWLADFWHNREKGFRSLTEYVFSHSLILNDSLIFSLILNEPVCRKLSARSRDWVRTFWLAAWPLTTETSGRSARSHRVRVFRFVDLWRVCGRVWYRGRGFYLRCIIFWLDCLLKRWRKQAINSQFTWSTNCLKGPWTLILSRKYHLLCTI